MKRKMKYGIKLNVLNCGLRYKPRDKNLRAYSAKHIQILSNAMLKSCHVNSTMLEKIPIFGQQICVVFPMAERCLPAYTRQRFDEGREVRTERRVRRFITVRVGETVIGITEY